MKLLPRAYKNQAIKLAVMFLEDQKIPARFKRNSTRKPREDSKVEQYFQEAREGWEMVMLAMMEEELPVGLMERLLFLELDDQDPFQTLTENQDWNMHLEYLELRRNVRNCPDDELGRLAMIMGAYQKLVEKKVKKKAPLKNPLAQELMEKGEIIYEGHLVKFYQKDSRSIADLKGEWNKTEKIAFYNSKVPADGMKVLFSGEFQIPRHEIYTYASNLCMCIQTGLRLNTDMFVFASERVSPDKFAEYIQAREAGRDIKLMCENDFLKLVPKGKGDAA